MNTLSFIIKYSPKSNDHELRIIIDGEDWLGEGYLGLDPPIFFQQKNLLDDGKLIVGRCTCGSMGCGDYWVRNSVSDNKVEWIIEYPYEERQVFFDKNDYLTLFKEASTDYSWEDLNRKVERLVLEIFENEVDKNQYPFKWASTRIDSNIIKLSFHNHNGQELYEFPWDGKSVNNAIENAKSFYKKNFALK